MEWERRLPNLILTNSLVNFYKKCLFFYKTGSSNIWLIKGFPGKKSGKHFFWRHDWNNSFKDFCTIFSSIVSESILSFLFLNFLWKQEATLSRAGTNWSINAEEKETIIGPDTYITVSFFPSKPHSSPLSSPSLSLPILPPSHVVFSCPFLCDNYMSFPSLALAVVINRGHCEQVCKTDWNACAYQCVGGTEVLTHNLTSLPFS